MKLFLNRIQISILQSVFTCKENLDRCWSDYRLRFREIIYSYLLPKYVQRLQAVSSWYLSDFLALKQWCVHSMSVREVVVQIQRGSSSSKAVIAVSTKLAKKRLKFGREVQCLSALSSMASLSQSQSQLPPPICSMKWLLLTGAPGHKDGVCTGNY